MFTCITIKHLKLRSELQVSRVVIKYVLILLIDNLCNVYRYLTMKLIKTYHIAYCVEKVHFHNMLFLYV